MFVGTCVVIVADYRGGLTTKGHIARIDGATIAIVTNRRCVPAVASGCITEPIRTGIAVITCFGIVDALTGGLIAKVDRTEVVICTNGKYVCTGSGVRIAAIHRARDSIIACVQVLTLACIFVADIHSTWDFE